MGLIKGTIHSHRDGQLVQVAVLPDLVDKSGQPGAAELRCPATHDAAHLLHQDAVVAGGAGEAQVLQDGADLTHGQPVAVGTGAVQGPVLDNSVRFTSRCSPQDLLLKCKAKHLEIVLPLFLVLGFKNMSDWTEPACKQASCHRFSSRFICELWAIIRNGYILI